MRELGEYLRQMRESQGLTLEQVAEAIKVSIKYLQALEEGQYNVLPPEIYVRGFLTAYGEFLGINPQELYARFDADRPKRKKWIFSSKEEKPQAPIVAKSPAQTQPEEAQRKISLKDIWHSIKAIPAVAYIFAIAIVILGLVIIISLGGEKPPETISQAVLGDTTLQHAATAPVDADIAQHIRIPIDSVNAAQALSIAESLTFIIRTRELVNIYVELDHAKKVFKGMMTPAERYTWRAKNSLYIETGNPSALRISVNGFDLVPFEIRHPQTLEINRQNVLQFVQGYLPLAPGITSAYGQRVEGASGDTVKGPPSEVSQKRIAKNPQTAQEDTSSKGKQKIKPPKTKSTPDQQDSGKTDNP